MEGLNIGRICVIIQNVAAFFGGSTKYPTVMRMPEQSMASARARQKAPGAFHGLDGMRRKENV